MVFFHLLNFLSHIIISTWQQTVPKLQFNSSLHLNGSIAKHTTRRFFTEAVSKAPPKSQCNLSVFGKILIGGTSAVALSFRCNRFVVSCNANRLAGLLLQLNCSTKCFACNERHSFLFAGYQAKAIKNDSVAFDWHKFWQYLKPYLLKFLGAIAVSSFPC